MAGQLPSFGWGGTGSVMTDADMSSAVFDRALPFLDTASMAATSGFLQSRGVGTAVRDFQLPAAAPTQEGDVLDVPGSDRPMVVETPGYVSDRLGGTAAEAGIYMGARPETTQELGVRRDEAGAITEEQYKASPYFRADIPYSPAMTAARVQVQAEIRDAQKARDFFQEKRPITSFFGQLAGGAVDPVNYIPVAGPLVRAAAVARMGRVLGTAAIGATDAGVNQALASALTAPDRQQFGDDVSWQAQVTDIAMGALTGGIIGGVAGAVGRSIDIRAERLENQMKARAALDDAAGSLARDGEVRLTPTSAGFADEVRADVAPPSALRVDPSQAETLRSDIRSLVETAQAVSDRKVAMGLGGVAQPEAISTTVGVDLAGYTHTMDNYAIRHALKQHGDPAIEASRGQVAITPDDFERVPDILTSPDAIYRNGETPRGEPVVLYEKQIGDRYYYAEEVRKGRRQMAMQTLYKRTTREAAGRPIEGSAERAGLPADLTPSRELLKQPTATDISSPRAQIDPARIQQAGRAEATVGKPEMPSAMAKDVGYDPVTGESPITPLVRQIEAEGRLTPESAAEIKVADDGIKDADAFAKALEVATGCVL